MGIDLLTFLATISCETSIRYTSENRLTGITEAVHAKDADVVDVSRLVGHKNLRTTMEYSHVADDRLHSALLKLPKLAAF